jgi:hypothetical protein
MSPLYPLLMVSLMVCEYAALAEWELGKQYPFPVKLLLTLYSRVLIENLTATQRSHHLLLFILTPKFIALLIWPPHWIQFWASWIRRHYFLKLQCNIILRSIPRSPKSSFQVFWVKCCMHYLPLTHFIILKHLVKSPQIIKLGIIYARNHNLLASTHLPP